jgi:predicted nucleic acid-binding protein
LASDKRPFAQSAWQIWRTESIAPILPFAAEVRRAFLDDLKATLPVYPITAETAELVGAINAESSRKGITIPFDDLLIDCCALERGFSIATRNERHFRRIPGLDLIHL